MPCATISVQSGIPGTYTQYVHTVTGQLQARPDSMDAELWTWFCITATLVAFQTAIVVVAPVKSSTKFRAAWVLFGAGLALFVLMFAHSSTGDDSRSSAHSFTRVFDDVRELVAGTVYPLLPLPMLLLLVPVCFLILIEHSDVYSIYIAVGEDGKRDDADENAMRTAAVKQSRILGGLFSMVVVTYVTLSAIARMSQSNSLVVTGLSAFIMAGVGWGIRDFIASIAALFGISSTTPIVPGCTITVGIDGSNRPLQFKIVKMTMFFVVCRSLQDNPDGMIVWTHIPNSVIMRGGCSITTAPVDVPIKV